MWVMRRCAIARSSIKQCILRGRVCTMVCSSHSVLGGSLDWGLRVGGGECIDSNGYIHHGSYTLHLGKPKSRPKPHSNRPVEKSTRVLTNYSVVNGGLTLFHKVCYSTVHGKDKLYTQVASAPTLAAIQPCLCLWLFPRISPGKFPQPATPGPGPRIV